MHIDSISTSLNQCQHCKSTISQGLISDQYINVINYLILLIFKFRQNEVIEICMFQGGKKINSFSLKFSYYSTHDSYNLGYHDYFDGYIVNLEWV